MCSRRALQPLLLLLLLLPTSRTLNTLPSVPSARLRGRLTAATAPRMTTVRVLLRDGVRRKHPAARAESPSVATPGLLRSMGQSGGARLERRRRRKGGDVLRQQSHFPPWLVIDGRTRYCVTHGESVEVKENA